MVEAAERWHHVLPAGNKQLWATEVSWDSKPPDPHGIPVNEQARFVEQTMYVLWSQGVSTVLWLQIIDQPPIPSYATTYQGGMYYLSGHPKPAVEALLFPFVTQRRSARVVQAWGRAPQSGSLRIEQRRGWRWKTIRTLRLREHQVFLVNLSIRGRTVMRAQTRHRTSRTWTS